MEFESEYSEYRAYIEEFAKTIDPNDQLPLRVSGYSLRDYEIHGEILDWLMNYLGRGCPTMIRNHLIQSAIKETMEKVNTSPSECGFDPDRNSYQPLKLVKVVVSIVNKMILDLQSNEELYKIPLPPTSPNASELTKLTQPPKYSVDAIKNTRRTMEDKHMIVEDFNAFFNTQDTEPTFYYGIFDGHSGSDAASYANSHLNYNIAVHPKYPSDIENAMREAFRVTDMSFLKKAHTENLSSGTTALCAMYRKTEKKLYVGWCGDSQALIARLGNVRQIVTKHSPEDESERKRIEALGGVVLFWGNSYRVNGQLAVSRAIGDLAHKPFVSAEPEIECINLDGEEDFIVLGCDGLWDNLTEDDVAIFVYKQIKENPDNYRSIASNLCSLSKAQGSRDNISVIVVFLKEPQLIATQSWPSRVEHSEAMENLNMYEEPPVANPVTMDALGNTNQDIYNNPFGDFNNQLISDVAIGKSTEITDLVMQQQPENAFCNLTDTMNNINNNKFNNGHDEDNFMMDQASPEPVEQSAIEHNDDNNNSNDNNGPETNVDAIDEDFQQSAVGAVGGEKEKIQMEFKETEDVADRAEVMDFGVDHSAAIYDTLENKIFETMSLQNPEEFSKGDNPFMSEDIEASVDAAEEFLNNKIADAEEFMDNKMVEEELHAEAQSHFEDFAHSMGDFVNQKMDEAVNMLDEGVAGFMDQPASANGHADEAEEHPQAPEDDLGFVEVAQQPIGESGEESEDEWNYVQVDKKAADDLPVVEETSEPAVEEEVSIDQPESEHNLSLNESKKIDDISEPIEESLKDSDQEKEPEEERQAQDEVEKDLQLSVETEDFDDMSQLNPEAKVFVPISPTRSNGPMSPPLNDIMNPVNQLLNNFVTDDSVVAQSPRKGEAPAMEDILIPSEKDFDIEVESRPHEINPFAENGNGFGSPDVLNLKESLQKDDKLEQEYKDEAQPFFEEEKQQVGGDYKELESSFTEYSNGFQNIIDDPMNRSFYEGRDNGDIMAPAGRTSDVLNTVQKLFDDEQPEADMINSEGSILEFNNEANVLNAAAAPPMDLSDNFEAEHFMEEIKGATDKYNDQGLSPTLPEVNSSIMQNVEEAFKENLSLNPVEDSLVAAVEEPRVDLAAEKPQEEMEIKEPPPTPAEDVKEQPALVPEPEVKESIVNEVAVGAVAAAAVAGVAIASKQPTASKPETKKTDVKAKAPIASKTNPVPAKRAPVSTTAAKTVGAKPASAPVAAKPPPIRKATSSTTTAAAKPAAKPVASSAPSSRPTVPPVRKPASATAPKTATDTAAKPAVKATGTIAKKPATSLATTKPPTTRPASASVPAKPKLTNGTSSATAERKPLTSSAASTRVAAKPTSLAPAKPKAIGTSTVTAKPAMKTVTSTRLSVSSAEKSATSPTKEKLLSRTLASPATRSPRPTTTTATAKPGVKDLKSPAAAKSPSLGAVGVRKPLSTVKKSPASTTTSTTVIKKSPGVKKTTTTTTTVVQKKVVNGDIVKEETTTTQTTSGDPQLIEELLKASQMSGHENGNGLTENGNGDALQMVLDSAAD